LYRMRGLCVVGLYGPSCAGCPFWGADCTIRGVCVGVPTVPPVWYACAWGVGCTPWVECLLGRWIVPPLLRLMGGGRVYPRLVCVWWGWIVAPVRRVSRGVDCTPCVWGCCGMDCRCCVGRPCVGDTDFTPCAVSFFGVDSTRRAGPVWWEWTASPVRGVCWGVDRCPRGFLLWGGLSLVCRASAAEGWMVPPTAA
jgi:hypothetical protein